MALTERGAYASATLTEDGRLVIASLLTEDGEIVFGVAAPAFSPVEETLPMLVVWPEETVVSVWG